MARRRVGRRGRVSLTNGMGRGDWIVAEDVCSTAGVRTAGSNNSWGDSVQTCVVGNSFTYQAVDLPQAGTSGVPNTGRLLVSAIHGSIFVIPDTAADVGIIAGAVGIYLAKENGVGTTWTVRNPANNPDAARDDYLFLRPFAINFQSAIASTPPPGWFEIPITMPLNLLLGAGDALHVTVGCSTNSAEPLYFVPYFRTMIRRAM